MKAYLAVFSARVRMLLQYRAAALAGFCTQLFWGGIRMMIFTAFYESAGRLDLPMSLAQTVSYIWLGQAFLGLIPFRVDGEIGEMIRTGRVAYELLRPVDLYGFWLARTVANRLAPTLLRCVPMLIVAGALGWLKPAGVAAVAAFVASLTAALLLSSSFTMLMNVSLFWTTDGRGVSLLMGGVMFAFSGMIVPLPLMPELLKPVIYALPFRGMIDIPFRLFTGSLGADAVGRLLVEQLGWAAALILLGRWLLGRAARRLAVQGG